MPPIVGRGRYHDDTSTMTPRPPGTWAGRHAVPSYPSRNGSPSRVPAAHALVGPVAMTSRSRLPGSSPT
ncbi:hypothetical protein ACWDRB_01815 [Nonomuraea sp. NPDC003707]